MLRRQALRPARKPLVALTPKSLLRHKLAVSDLDELCRGRFYNVIPERDAIDVDDVDRVVICSGKVFYDLLETRRESGASNVAIVRLEQLYPFPEDEFAAAIGTYPNLREVVWCQEEPMNQGAWYSMQHRLRRTILAQNENLYLAYAGRDAFAAPAVGYASVHTEQQQQLVHDALFG
jgi:2-oxoglutarate dehydrogenase E1 component